MTKWILLFLTQFIVQTYGLSQTCCSGGVPLSNNIGGLPASSKGTWQFSLSGDLNTLNTLKEGSEELDDDSRERKTFSALLKSSYSITDRFFVEGLLSWVAQERIITQQNGFTDYDKTQGIGDAVMLVNYAYLNKNNLKLIGAIGPKLPTGASDIEDENGLTLNADLQPGSGAWDGIFLHRIQLNNTVRPSQTYYLNVTYRYAGINDQYLGNQQYQFGNEVQLLSGVADQFLIGSALISFGLNARYRSVNQDRFNDQSLPNTGGRWLFVMPVVGWHIRSNLIIGLNGELPLYAHVDGTQLTPTYRINGSIYYSWKKK